MTGTTVISLELAIVTVLRQPGELPQVHRRQQSVSHAKSTLFFFKLFKKFSNGSRA